MLNKYLLKEGRPSRPKKVFQITALISLLIIGLSTAFYFLAAYLPGFKEPINNFRVVFQILSKTFDLNGIDAVKILISVPLTCIGAFVGGINLIRVTNRKGFLSVLHVLPVLGIIIFVVGASFFFLVPTYIFSGLPIDYSTSIPYVCYVGGALVWGGGIVIADIFCLFYPVMNYTQFHPIYKTYRYSLRMAKTNTARSRIRHYFYYYWKKRRYDDMLKLLFVEKNGGDTENMDVDSYVFFRNGALEHMSEEKARELDELYETEQYDILDRELALLSSDKEIPPKIITEEEAKPAAKPIPVPEKLEPDTIEVGDETEDLSHYGKHLAKKGRRRMMAQAAKEKNRAARSAARAERKARRSRG